MSIKQTDDSLSIDWRLPLCIRKPEAVLGWTLAHVADIDATLTIRCWPVEGRPHDWEPTHARIGGVIVTRDSDTIAWALIERAVRTGFEVIDGLVQQRIRDFAEAA